ncbi:MAG: 3'-5' exonuclease [Clostridiales bacterium]|nr:3'-5' exonuclease [Clostridiales bacterium]
MILFFDTETSGLKPGQICQLSYVMQEGDKLSSRNLFFSVDFVEQGAYAVHGFSKSRLDVLSGGKRFESFIDVIEKDFNRADVVVAHNVSFDVMFMRAEFERLNRTFKTNAEFCSMKNSTPLCQIKKAVGKGYKYPKLNELCSFLGITNQRILSVAQKVFGANCGFHDARFDTSALLLAVNSGLEYEQFKELKRFL